MLMCNFCNKAIRILLIAKRNKTTRLRFNQEQVNGYGRITHILPFTIVGCDFQGGHCDPTLLSTINISITIYFYLSMIFYQIPGFQVKDIILFPQKTVDSL